MNIKNMAMAAAIILIAAFGVKYAMEPQSYEDCVLKAMSKTESDRAAWFAKQACQVKFGITSTQQARGIKPAAYNGKLMTPDEFFGTRPSN
jgi:hypothetical protein